MPKNKEKPKKNNNPKPEKLKGPAVKGIQKMANAYSVYEQRLGLRTAMTEKEKMEQLKRFMVNYQDDIKLYIVDSGIGSGTEEEILKEKGLKGTSLAFVKSWQAFAADNGTFKSETATQNINYSYGAYWRVKEKLEKNADAGTTANEEGADFDEVPPEQAKGLREIAKWLYRNSEDRTAARRGSAHLGNTDHSIFIESILNKTAKQRLLIFYLVEKGKAGKCTAEDVVNSQSYIPDLEAFKKKMHKSGIKRLFKKESINWETLGTAVQSAGVSINSLNKLANEHEEQENQKEKEESDKDRKDKYEHNLSALTLEFNGAKLVSDPELDEQVRMLPQISKEIREMLDSQDDTKGTKDPSKADKSKFSKFDGKRYETLILALSKIKGNLAASLKNSDEENPNAHAGTDPKSPKAKDLSMLKKLGDGLTKMPITPMMSAGTALNGIAVLLKVVSLIKDHSILSGADVSERVLSLLASCADVSANASKLGLITTAVNTGTNVAGAMSTANAVGGALGVASGGLSMTVAAIQSGRADALRKGINKAGGYLDSMDDQKSDDAVMANNIKGLATSMYHIKAYNAGKNMIAGTLTAIGGALALSGVGMIGSMVLIGLGMLVGIGGGKVGGAMAGKETVKVVDAFLGLDRIIDSLQLPDRNKEDKAAAVQLKNQLRQYGEAKLGAASHAQAAKIIMSRYAHFLWVKTFTDGHGGFRDEKFYNDPINAEGDDNKLAFACKTFVSSLGVKIRYGANGTKEDEIRRRLSLS